MIYDVQLGNKGHRSQRLYSLVPIRRHGTINQHTAFIWPSTFPKIWSVNINWINTLFWSTSRGTFDKNNLATIEYTFVGMSINWIVTFSMPWGMTINRNMSSNWHQRVQRPSEVLDQAENSTEGTNYTQSVLPIKKQINWFQGKCSGHPVPESPQNVAVAETTSILMSGVSTSF